MTTKTDQLRARINALTTDRLIECYLLSAQALEAAPQGPDANEHIIILGMMDMETLRRDIPCCAECSVPTAAGWHATSMHADTATNRLADAIVDTAISTVKGT